MQILFDKEGNSKKFEPSQVEALIKSGEWFGEAPKKKKRQPAKGSE